MEFQKTPTRKYTLTQAKLDLKTELLSPIARDSRDNYGLLWVGEGGIGKSSVIQQVANEVDCTFRSWHHGATIEEDNHGVQYRDDSVTRWAIPEHLENLFDLKGKKGIIFLDEIYSGQTIGHQNFVRMLIDRKFHNRTIDPGWLIVGATNPETNDYLSVRSVDKALHSRMLVYDIDPSAEELLEYWHDSMPHPIKGMLVHNHFLGNLNFVKALSPRNWMKLARAVERRWKSGFSIAQLAELIAANSTPELATTFTKYMHIGTNPNCYPLGFGDIAEGNWRDRVTLWLDGVGCMPLIAASQWNLLLTLKKNSDPKTYNPGVLKEVALFLEQIGTKYAELSYNTIVALSSTSLGFALLSNINNTTLRGKLEDMLNQANEHRKS